MASSLLPSTRGRAAIRAANSTPWSCLLRLADESQRRLVHVGERGGGPAKAVRQEHDLVELHQGLAVVGGFVDGLGSGQQPGLLDKVSRRVGGIDVRDDLRVAGVGVVVGGGGRIGEPYPLPQAPGP